MGGYLSFDVKVRDTEVIEHLQRLTIDKVSEILDYVKIQYESSFLLTE
jgi:hypothetical protein